MWVQRPPQVSPYLREKPRKLDDVNQEDDGKETTASSRSFESFLTPERRQSVANDGKLLHGSTLYHLANQSGYNPFTGDSVPCHRFYRKIHHKSRALALTGFSQQRLDI